MIAMDVVDDAAPRSATVERELNDEARRKDLIERLREIYRGQGIEVPDHVLEQGVNALEQDRFVYKAPADSLKARLARLYVSRGRWGKYAGGAAAAVGAVWLWDYAVIERPKREAQATIQRELATTLPQRLDKAVADIRQEARDPAVVTQAEQLRVSGQNAATSGDIAQARKVASQLDEMLKALRDEYEIRIVSREGQLTGLWRVPKAAPDTYNYYLVVEAVDAAGKRLARTIENEETGSRDTVSLWAQRVDRSVLEGVRADKLDDGIIQKSVAGRKTRGTLKPEWTIPVAGGAITRW